MDAFALLLDVVIALGVALTLGLILARLRQSAVVGYLLAGVLIGPHALGLLRAVAEVRAMAELGVALLLFTIGLELPWQRLRALGAAVAGAGLLQIGVTAATTLAIAAALGISVRQGAVLGMIIAFSSTAVVFRLLADRAEIDSVPGRVSVGVLLVQDAAVIPLVLLIPVIAGASAGWETLRGLLGTLGAGVLLIAALYILARTLLPLLFNFAAAVRNRELFVILALTFCLGATWVAHAAQLSPVVGAFAAGALLADTRFAPQLRAEIAPLRAGFLALFFVSIGMLADPGWVLRNALLVGGLILAIIVGKTLITALVVRSLGYTTHIALVTGVTLAHIGELSFVVAEVGRSQQLIDAETFRLVVSASVATLLVAPYLIGASGWLASLARLRAPAALPGTAGGAAAGSRSGHVIVVGCGPTGLRVVQALEDVGTPYLVLELNPRTVRSAALEGKAIEFGDASQEEVLRHAGIMTARALVVTVPDPATAVAVISSAKELRPDVLIVARARYAKSARELLRSGAEVLLNEEELMGEHLAAVSLKLLGLASEAMARLEAAAEAVAKAAAEDAGPS